MVILLDKTRRAARVRQKQIVQGRITSNYQPHPGQAAFHHSMARYRTATCGRRWGKTVMGLAEAGSFARKHAGAIVWWVAPTYKFARRNFRFALKAFVSSIVSKSSSELWLEFANGARIEFHSADQPDNLRGEGIWLLLLDEASLMVEGVWEALRPALTDRSGRVALFFTPKGMGHWTYQLWMRGRDPMFSFARKGPIRSYESFHFPSSSNPYLSLEEIEEAKESMPQDMFEQEYLAEWKEDSAGVFKNLDKICVASSLLGPIPGGQYGIGIDLAKTQDFTVLSVFDMKRKLQVFMKRLSTMRYSEQKEVIIAESERWNRAKLMVDSTGVGEPVCDDLEKAIGAFRLNKFHFTGDSKQALVENMVVDFENESVHLLDDEIQRNELAAFTYTLSPTRKIRYSAPEGCHDDTVIAAGLGMALCHDINLWTGPSRIGKSLSPLR